jgi:hypothetical protein
MQTLKKLPQTAPNSAATAVIIGEDSKAAISSMTGDAKVTGALTSKRIWAVGLAAVSAVGGLGACKRDKNHGTMPAQKVAVLADALRPDAFAAALKRIGGAHFHATARFAAGPAGGAPNVVTTTTDVWVDRTGNYRFREQNDRDGGREVVLHGRELAVALRYGKMIRRVAEEPEPSRLLEEALGAPFAVFDLVARRARVAQAGNELVGGARATVFELQPGEGAAEPGPSQEGLRKWRNKASIEGLSGRVVVDDATGALVRSDLRAKFSTAEPKPVEGTVEVHTVLTEVASTPAIEKPSAEDLAMRQRTLPEQRELLRGLGQARAAAEPPRVGVRSAPAARGVKPGPAKTGTPSGAAAAGTKGAP